MKKSELRQLIREEISKVLKEGKRETELINQVFTQMGYNSTSYGQGGYTFEKKFPEGSLIFGAQDSAYYVDRPTENIYTFNVMFYPYKTTLGIKTNKPDYFKGQNLLKALENSQISFDLGIGLFSQSDDVIKKTIAGFIRKHENNLLQNQTQ